MPHIIVEYSENLRRLDLPVLLTELHDRLATFDTIDKTHVKTRATPVSHLVIGNTEDPDELLHITLRLMPGRPLDLKKNMAGALYSIACAMVREFYEKCSVTLEIVELDAETYIK